MLKETIESKDKNRKITLSKVTKVLSRVMWLFCFVTMMIFDNVYENYDFPHLLFVIIIVALALYGLCGAIIYPLRKETFDKVVLPIIATLFSGLILCVFCGVGPPWIIAVGFALMVISIYVLKNFGVDVGRYLRFVIMPIVYILLFWLIYVNFSETYFVRLQPEEECFVYCNIFGSEYKRNYAEFKTYHSVGGKVGAIDQNGNKVIPAIYGDMFFSKLSDSIILVVDKTGQKMAAYKYDKMIMPLDKYALSFVYNHEGHNAIVAVREDYTRQDIFGNYKTKKSLYGTDGHLLLEGYDDYDFVKNGPVHFIKVEDIKGLKAVYDLISDSIIMPFDHYRDLEVVSLEADSIVWEYSLWSDKEKVRYQRTTYLRPQSE